MPSIVKKTFEEAAAAGALLIAQVKDNQTTLHPCAEQVCQTSTPVDQTTTKDAKRRSRDETRVVEVGEFGQLRPGSLLPGARLKPTAAKLETVSVERKYSDITWHYAKAKKAQERGQGRDSSHLAYDGGICRNIPRLFRARRFGAAVGSRRTASWPMMESEKIHQSDDERI